MIKTKYCYNCKKEKPLTEWNKNKSKKDGLATECRSCNNARTREWYARPGNADKHKALLYKRRLANKQRLMAHYGNKCCDCGGSFPECVYDFHHLDPSQKDTSFGKINTNSWARIEKEIIGKCVMLCANCHRIRHAKGT